MRIKLLIIVALIAIVGFSTPLFAEAFVKGIYITQSTAESSKRMRYLIKEAKSVGISTFVIDIYYKNSRYAKNIALVKKNGIRYVARVVVFPYGGTPKQVRSKAYWEKRWRQAKYAIQLGAEAIQLDYIRYKPTQRSSSQNAKEIYEVIKFFRNRLKGTGVRLQIDIFGVAAHGHSKAIGQDVSLFANAVDAINPMVYPSHYEPFRHHAVRPYETVLDSVIALREQLGREHPHIRIHAFIELYNYRFPMSYQTRVRYIKAQMQAARDAGANGYYVWSARNKYKILFRILKDER